MGNQASQASGEEGTRRGALERSGVRMPNFNHIDIFTSENVLRCLGFNPRELEGAYKPLVEALARGGVLRQNFGTLSALVRGGLPAGYVRGQIDGGIGVEDFQTEDSPSNLILVQYDLRGGKKTSIRGIALCQVMYGGKIVRASDRFDEFDISLVTMELLVLGNARGPTAKLRSEVFSQGGGNIIRLVQYIGSKLPAGISLYGLETVITLYWKFGWRFLTSCKVAPREKYELAEKALLAFFKTHGPPEIEGVTRDEETQDAYDAELRKLLMPFVTYSKGYYDKLAHTSEGKQSAEEEGRDMGYHMILCQNLNPYSQMGGRKRRKKTKRRRPVRRKTKRRKTHKRKAKRRRRTRGRRHNHLH